MEFLLEITTEEMPSSHIKSGLSQLKEKLGEVLRASSIAFTRINTYGTCRRLVVVGNFAPEQKDRVEDIIGPPKAAAFDESGDPKPAAVGFANKHGLTVDNLIVLKTEKGEYVGARKITKGAPTVDILKGSLPTILSSLSFPKMMRWGKSALRFSRPIQNILCIFGEKPILFRVGEVSSSDITTGHKIFSPRKIRPKNFSEYKKALIEQYVVVDQDKRKRLILKQTEKMLLFLGSGFARKGLDVAIHGLGHMPSGYHLVIVGKGRSGSYQKLAAVLVSISAFSLVNIWGYEPCPT